MNIRASKGRNIGEVLQMVIALVSITFITALLLSLVNQMTAPVIAQSIENTRAAAMRELIPGAEFTPIEIAAAPVDKSVPDIQNIYKATVDGADAGYCMEVLPNGFSGTMTVVVGIHADGTVAGVKITQHAETPGLGAKAQSDPAWAAQFEGRPASGMLAVTQDGGDVSSITGATITSRAVTDAVNSAAGYVLSLAS